MLDPPLVSRVRLREKHALTKTESSSKVRNKRIKEDIYKESCFCFGYLKAIKLTFDLLKPKSKEVSGSLKESLNLTTELENILRQHEMSNT